MPPKKKARMQSKSDEELEKLVKWVRIVFLHCALDSRFFVLSFSGDQKRRRGPHSVSALACSCHTNSYCFLFFFQLSRDQLEGFVLSAVRSGSLPAANLWNSVPQRAVAEIRKTEAPIRIGNERVGTGSFDSLDQSIMRQIFSYCGLRGKITCVTRVCKAWRAYKEIPGLFTDLSEKLAVSRRASIFNKAAFLDNLLDFVPDETAVEAVRMATSKSDDHNLCNAIFKRLGALKKKAEKEGTPFHLKKLVLQGEKLSPTVIKRLAASGICSSLTSLVFEDVDGSKKLYKEDAVPNLLKVCPNLEEFLAPPSLLLERSLSFHLAALSTARGGAPPLLKVLDLTDPSGWGGDRYFNWEDLSTFGTRLPCLQVLKLSAIAGTPVQADPTAEGFTEASPPLSEFLVEPFAPLPNLRVLEVKRIKSRFGEFANQLTPRYVTTPYLTKVMTRLMEAAPSLESLVFGHGLHGHVSKKALRQGRLIVPPLPTSELGMLPLPATLKNLDLSSMLVVPSEFMGLDVRGFENIQFRFCGPEAVETAQLLYQQAPVSFHMTISEDGKMAGLSRRG